LFALYFGMFGTCDIKDLVLFMFIFYCAAVDTRVSCQVLGFESFLSRGYPHYSTHTP